MARSSVHLFMAVVVAMVVFDQSACAASSMERRFMGPQHLCGGEGKAGITPDANASEQVSLGAQDL